MVDTVSVGLLKASAWFVSGLAIASLGFFFYQIGLDKADKVASGAGIFVGIIGLGISTYTAILTSRAAHQTKDAQSVTSSQVGGGVFQARNIAGNIRIRSAPEIRRPPINGTAIADGEAEELPTSGQVIRRSQIFGSVSQIDEIGGDVEIEQ